MEQNKATDVRNIVANQEIPTTEHFAMEILKQEQRKSKALIIGLSAGLIVSGMVAITAIAYGANERKHLVETNYQNDCDWRKLFSDYDFISQDGEGINNANYGEQGDLLNGTTTEVEEESNNQ